MNQVSRLFIGGGQDYHGPTAQRDREIVTAVAQCLANEFSEDIQLVTGGMPGIPDDFARAYRQAGGTHVLCVVSSEQEEAFRKRNEETKFDYQVIGESQEKRRIAVTKLEGIKAALFIQGGKYSTHEMKLFEENGIPIITLWSSGGAAGGTQPYEGYSYGVKPIERELCDPEVTNAVDVAKALVDKIKLAIQIYKGDNLARGNHKKDAPQMAHYSCCGSASRSAGGASARDHPPIAHQETCSGTL